jgi:copper chaperone CopZ
MRMLSTIAIVFVLSAPALVRATDGRQTEKSSTETCILKVSGMTCPGCEVAVRMAARTVDGVTAVKVSYAKGNAEVTYDPMKTNPDAIAKVITERSGFKAERIRKADKK